MERTLDLVFPPQCVGCGRLGRWICAGCWRKVSWLQSANDVPSSPPPGLDAVLCVAEFDGTAREAVHALKYEERYAIAGLMGRLMAAQLGGREADLVAPVSLHPARRRERGYDQAALLARHLARHADIPFDRNAIKRVRRTRQQVSLDADQRRANVQGAFRAGRELADMRLVLVDDVFTTGATLSAAAQAAREAGADSVIGMVFAVAPQSSRSSSKTTIPVSNPAQS